MKDEKQLLDYEIPQIKEEDIMETIMQSKKLLKHAPLQKRETRTLKQMQQICYYHFPKIFALQLVLTVILFLAICPSLSKQHTQYIVSVILMVGGILFSMITSAEILRNHFYDMWETEKACSIRMEKIIGFKLSLLSISTFLLFCLMSMILSSMDANTGGIGTIAMALLPYLCITTCIVQLKEHLSSIPSILSVYAGLTMFFLIPMMSIDSYLFVFIEQNSLVLLILCFLLCFFLNAIKLKKTES